MEMKFKSLLQLTSVSIDTYILNNEGVKFESAISEHFLECNDNFCFCKEY